MLEILSVEPGSIAAELAMAAGDRLVSIAGRPVVDLLDVALADQAEDLRIELLKTNGEIWLLEFDKDAEEPLGLNVPHPEPEECGNQCLFCFVHQLPRGMRESLYVKDEDYRFSFLYGAYVTLTNIGDEDVRRIIEQRLSPLYVSVHASDEELRRTLLGRQGPAILPLLRRLVEAGISLHTQIVLCPGLNDGSALLQTLTDLHALGPNILSLAVVPVGLTGHRRNLPPLRLPTIDEARRTLAMIHDFQEECLRQGGSRFVFAADELYLQADRPFPSIDDYEDLAQLENGVGLIPLFREEAEQVLEGVDRLSPGPFSVLTGESAAAEVSRFASALEAAAGTKIFVHVIRNEFFGGGVTVAGLVTGRDILQQLRGVELGQRLLVPEVMLRDGEDVFLDDLRLEDLARELNLPTTKFDSSPWGLIEALEGQP
jgi:putative radical SAM enzyme (TIGR03279 family)